MIVDGVRGPIPALAFDCDWYGERSDAEFVVDGQGGQVAWVEHFGAFEVEVIHDGMDAWVVLETKHMTDFVDGGEVEFVGG